MRVSIRKGASGWCTLTLTTKRFKGEASPFMPQSPRKAEELTMKGPLKARGWCEAENRDSAWKGIWGGPLLSPTLAETEDLLLGGDFNQRGSRPRDTRYGKVVQGRYLKMKELETVFGKQGIPHSECETSGSFPHLAHRTWAVRLIETRWESRQEIHL